MNQNDPSNLDFSQQVSARYATLTKSEKQIANYVRKNQEETAFLSAGELADRLGLSEATIVRFARTLGYSNYPEMRAVLQQAFRRRVTHSVRLRGRLDDLREGGDIFERVTVAEIDYLTLALQTVDRQAIQNAVAAISAHEHIFVFGPGPSVSLVDLLDLRLTRFGKQVVPLTGMGREVLEPLLSMTDRDLLFVIAFFDVNPTLEIVLSYAKEVNCPVILLTDTLGSVIGDKANILLAAKRGPVSAFHSLVVPMTIINTILLEVANRNLESVTVKLDKLDQLRGRLEHPNGSS